MIKEHDLASKFVIEQDFENAVISMKRAGTDMTFTTNLYLSSNMYNEPPIETGKYFSLIISLTYILNIFLSCAQAENFDVRYLYSIVRNIQSYYMIHIC